MASQASVGLIVTAIGFLTGVWLFLPPFIVEYQKIGQDWTDATKNDLWTGGALIAISTLTLFALRDAARTVEQASTTEAGES